MSSAAPAPPVRRVRVMSSGRWHPPVAEQRMRQLIAIGSAQPGIGKSIVASNLAAAIAGLGQKVVLVDLDPHTPRQHALLGAAAAPARLDAWLDAKRTRRDAAPTATRVRNLRLLPYAGGPDGDKDGRRAIADELHDLEGDVVVVDIGGDHRDDLFDFFATRALRLLVTSIERSALEATYAFLKAAALRAERRHGADAKAVLAQFHGGLVGNWLGAGVEQESLHGFSRLVRAHLGIPLPVVGCLGSSERIPQSIVARQPLVVRRGVDDNVRAFHHMAEWAMASIEIPTRGCALDGAEIVVPPAPLPASLASYERRHPRFAIDWAATLELSEGITAVRVRDVSESGAGVETPLALRVGDTGVLHLDQLPGQPALPVVVRNVLESLRRVGLGFVQPGEATARLIAAAKAATKN